MTTIALLADRHRYSEPLDTLASSISSLRWRPAISAAILALRTNTHGQIEVRSTAWVSRARTYTRGTMRTFTSLLAEGPISRSAFHRGYYTNAPSGANCLPPVHNKIYYGARIHRRQSVNECPGDLFQQRGHRSYGLHVWHVMQARGSILEFLNFEDCKFFSFVLCSSNC